MSPAEREQRGQLVAENLRLTTALAECAAREDALLFRAETAEARLAALQEAAAAVCANPNIPAYASVTDLRILLAQQRHGGRT